VSGIDGSVNIDHETGFGSLDYALNVNIQLNRKQQASPTSAVADLLQVDNPQLFLKSAIGLNAGGFRAQATWNHTGGYNIIPTTTVPVQSRVKAYNTFDLFFKYDVASESKILRDLSLTLNVSNVFDKDPPVLLRNNPNEFGFANGFTLGRLIQLGITKKF
jgi:iron complex outermembrane receptor protein